MNCLERSLVEKAGYDFGFEHVQTSTEQEVILVSARHPAKAKVTQQKTEFEVSISSPRTAILNEELCRCFPEFTYSSGVFRVCSHNELGQILRRAANLAYALPNQAALEYQSTLDQELKKLPASSRGTEVERMVRQRVGQQAYRNAMLSYWGHGCAVTGITVGAVLRASHAKPWAECDNDEERLDVFNGFLLNANLDALFDRFMISFDLSGTLLVAPSIPKKDLVGLGLVTPLKLRWLAEEHVPYLKYHKNLFDLTHC